MILSDFDLESYIRGGRLVVEPCDADTVRENGLDLRLADEIAVKNTLLKKGSVVDPYDAESVKKEYIVTKNKSELVIPPRTQVLLSTLEYLELPDNLMGFVELRSTWARHGLSMPPTIIDAGFKGTITLEVINHGEYGLRLLPKTRFAHVIFSTTLNKVRNTYSGTYLGQRGIKLPKVIKELP
ncbi:dCTP deaminase [bacterium]|nr:MAG: dCTP deaminase [bacterium]